MSSKPYVSERQKWNLKRYFVIYSNNPKMTLQHIAIKSNLDSTTIGKHFKKLFGKEYISVSKEKSKWNKKISGEQIKIAFEQYKKGKTTKDIAKDFGVKREALVVRMRKTFGREFQKLAKIRRFKDMAQSRQKVSEEKIFLSFEKYKNNVISLAKLANELKIAESSLTRRFIKLFKEDYRKIARIRRDERKVTKEEYKRVFEKYKTTNTSLAQLSEELEIRISTLRPVFLRMFGNEYVKVAKKKFDLVEVNRKGQLAEDIAMEFLKLSNIKIDDVRQKCVLEGTLKRPDFLIGNKFVEVKSGYLSHDSFGKIKGYNDIVSNYLGKRIKGTSKIIKSGMIFCLGGFSPKIRKNAKADKIELINSNDLKHFFEENMRDDLIKKLNSLASTAL